MALTVPDDFTWAPGQFVDLHAAGATRSLSRSPTSRTRPTRAGRAHRPALPRRAGLEPARAARSPPAPSCGSPARTARCACAIPTRPMAMIAGGSGIGPVLAPAAPAGRRGRRDAAAVGSQRASPSCLTCSRAAGASRRSCRGREIAGALDGVDGDHDVYMCGPPGLLDAAETELPGAASTRAGSSLTASPPRLTQPMQRTRPRRRPADAPRHAPPSAPSPSGRFSGSPPPAAAPPSMRTSRSTPSPRSTATSTAGGR